MATIPSTVREFNADCAKFMKIMGNKSYSQDAVKGAHKALTLRYFGLKDASPDQVEVCAMHLQIATNGALVRGWAL